MKIIVLFKTHLDVGFTDFAKKVTDKYNNKHIPDAISVAEEIALSDRKEGFVWTVGSWLIWQYLKTADKKAVQRLENAIDKGWISWHGLPFTTHSELCSGDLFDFNLSLSGKLDKRFGKKTVASKMTDVPGHTKAIVPYLKKHGIKLLHIGINPASTPVKVPPLFCWQFEGSEVIVMYNAGDYGEFTPIEGTDTFVYFAHTGDNLGPQSAEEVFAVYDELKKKYPEAQITAGDLNDVWEAVAPVVDTLPVLTDEIGDTWIHGAGTDPEKVSSYRALLRAAKILPQSEKEAVYEKIMIVPEHTWGLDEKTYLHENQNYRRDLFDKARQGELFKKMEDSWAEQRAYVTAAAEAVSDENKNVIKESLSELCCVFPNFDKCKKIAFGEEYLINGWKICVNRSGEVCYLEKDGKVYADENHRLCGFSYNEYSWDDVWEFLKSYLRKKFTNEFSETGFFNWAMEDFGKPNLEKEVSNATDYLSECDGLYLDGDTLIINHKTNEKLFAEHGYPETVVIRVILREEVIVDLQWFNKPANRAPEALWMSFNFTEKLSSIEKLGYKIDPYKIVDKGNRGMHATEGEICFGDITLTTLDAPLVSVGGKNVYKFRNDVADTKNGIYINLFNNQWGTNFPMWNEGNSRFRFIIR